MSLRKAVKTVYNSMCWHVVQASATSIMLELVHYLDQTIRTQGIVQHKRSDNIFIDKCNRKLNLLGNDEICKFVFLTLLYIVGGGAGQVRGSVNFPPPLLDFF